TSSRRSACAMRGEVVTSSLATSRASRRSSSTTPRPRLARPGSTPSTRKGRTRAARAVGSRSEALTRPSIAGRGGAGRRMGGAGGRRGAAGRRPRPSVLRQVALALPVVHGDAVLVVLLGLGLDQALEHVVAQRLGDHAGAAGSEE